ncbi:Anaphase-promoting complex subunit 7 [Camellia lanceoleosa]|uniref:Anaphase-promoting complex subunit 7 n=1 Tax=Camellia lanceoleosa TaxID=1840588 RepID=A0ACC0FVH0_9ERIC|nr:Anaphase-promoting complex subunit 7 [Camellia lanceoleosa]
MNVTNDTTYGYMVFICRAISVKFEAMNGGWFPTTSNGFSGTWFAGVRKVIPFSGQSNGPSIDENWAAALEHNPKAFAKVVMLYVDMEVNGVPLKVKFKIASCHYSLNENRAALVEMEGIPNKARNLQMNLMMGKPYRNSRHTRSSIACYKECLRYASCPRLFDGCVLDPTGGSRQLLWM